MFILYIIYINEFYQKIKHLTLKNTIFIIFYLLKNIFKNFMYYYSFSLKLYHLKKLYIKNQIIIFKKLVKSYIK